MSWLDDDDKFERVASGAMGCIVVLTILASLVAIIGMCVGIYLAWKNWA